MLWEPKEEAISRQVVVENVRSQGMQRTEGSPHCSLESGGLKQRSSQWALQTCRPAAGHTCTGHTCTGYRERETEREPFAALTAIKQASFDSG